jgi:iduronate 2-sulfatase
MPALILALACLAASALAAGKPNVVFIVCDDLNDYVTGMRGHPQAKTPCLEKLARSGVAFKRAYSNNPVCAPSRASFLTGIYPHVSRNFSFDKWYENPVLKKAMTLMECFRENDYHVAGTGKLMHHHYAKTWDEFYKKADYGPFVYDGKERVAHPSVPEPFRSIGPVDGSFAPLSDVPFNGEGSKGWIYGTWGKTRKLNYTDARKRDPTPDEINATWAVKKIKELARKPAGKPFFLGIGFIRPHTPLHVPKRFFDMFPLETVKIPVIKQNDNEDCHYLDVFDMNQKGPKYFQLLKQSYPKLDDGLKAYTQAYLACVAAVDECIGQVVDAVDKSHFKHDTIIVVTSDHGYNMGEKDYLFKNSLWEESARVPLVIRAPGVAVPGGVAEHPVSLIDIYPTLVDLCELDVEKREKKKVPKLDGHSLRPFLRDPKNGRWNGPDAALTMVFSGGQHKNNPAMQHWSVRTKRWRYILYNNGAEELYDHDNDRYEWTNLAKKDEHAEIKKKLKAKLMKMTGR